MGTGKFPKDDDFLDLGSTANRVFSLIKNVPRHQNYELYMDNYFLSIPLMNELRKVVIHSMGLIRIPNAAGFSDVCIPDDELSKLGDRVFAEYLCTGVDIEEPGIRLIRWCDSKIFNFAPTIERKRWRRTNGKWESLMVLMPSVIASYSKCM